MVKSLNWVVSTWGKIINNEELFPKKKTYSTLDVQLQLNDFEWQEERRDTPILHTVSRDLLTKEKYNDSNNDIKLLLCHKKNTLFFERFILSTMNKLHNLVSLAFLLRETCKNLQKPVETHRNQHELVEPAEISKNLLKPAETW